MGMFRTDADTGGMLVKIVGTDAAVTLNVDDVSGLGIFNKPGETLAVTTTSIISSVSLAADAAGSPVGVAVPAGTLGCFFDFPVITTGTHVIGRIPATGIAAVAFRMDQLISGVAMPGALPLTGAAILGFFVPYVNAGTKVYWTSTGDQTGKPAQVTFFG